MFYNFISSLPFSAVVLLAGRKTFARFFQDSSSFLYSSFSIKRKKNCFIISSGKCRLSEPTSIEHLSAIAVPSTECCTSWALSVREKSRCLVSLHDMKFCMQIDLKCSSCLHNLHNLKDKCCQTLVNVNVQNENLHYM